VSAVRLVMQTSPAPGGGAPRLPKPGKKPYFPEMIIARMRELQSRFPAVHDHGSRSRADGPDGTIAPTSRRQLLATAFFHVLGGSTVKAQFVIVAAR